MRPVRTLVAGLLAVTLAGCATGPVEREIPADGSASAFVLNRSEFGYTVYAANSATRQRLGFVDALRSGRFKIPGEVVSMGGAFALQAEGRGAGPDWQSDPFVVQPGAIVNWRLPDNDVYVR